MTTPETAADERGTLDEAQQPPGEASDLEAVRAYMRQLLDMLTQPQFSPGSAADGPASNDAHAQASTATPEGQAPKKQSRRPPLRGAKALPSHLERREVVVQPSAEECTCPECGEARKPLGEDVSHRLELEPARFYVWVEKRPKLACPRCKEGVATAPAGKAPLPGALPGQFRNDGVRVHHGQQDARSARNALLGTSVSHQTLEEGDLCWREADESRGASSHREELCTPGDYVYVLRGHSTIYPPRPLSRSPQALLRRRGVSPLTLAVRRWPLGPLPVRQDNARRFRMPRAPAKPPAAARSRRPTERNRKPSPLPRHIEIRQRRLPVTLSAALKQARKRAGMTQAEAVEGIGIAPEVYGRMERGGVLPSVTTLLRMCLILGSGPHELMGFAEVEPGQSAPGANTVPPGLRDTPEKRRLLRRLARLDSPRIKALARLVALLLPGR